MHSAHRSQYFLSLAGHPPGDLPPEGLGCGLLDCNLLCPCMMRGVGLLTSQATHENRATCSRMGHHSDMLT